MTELAMYLGYSPSDRAKKALQLGQTLKMLADEHGVAVQSLVGEALDYLLRKYGKHPFGPGLMVDPPETQGGTAQLRVADTVLGTVDQVDEEVNGPGP